MSKTHGKKMEVRVVLKTGEIEEYNPVEAIIISNLNGYDYEFKPEEITTIEIYPMEQS